MATVHRFEDLEVWQKSRCLAKLIFKLTSKDLFRSEYWLRNQIQRSCVSIMANIAEGFSRQSDREFRQFLYVAKGSCSEMQSHSCVALDQMFFSQAEFVEVSGELDHISRMLSNLIKHLSRQTP